MYKINYSNFEKWEKNCRRWLIFAIILSLICVYFSFENIIQKAFMTNQVFSTKIEKEVYPINNQILYTVYYEVEGKEYVDYVFHNDYYNILPTQNITVYYNKSNPYDSITEIENKIQPPHPAIILGIGILIVEFIQIINIKKQKKIVKELSYNGSLIKNMPYEKIIPMRRKHSKIWDVYIPEKERYKKIWWATFQKIKVNYQSLDGKTLVLVSEPKYYSFNHISPEVVDLLIDLNDPSKFFIDYNITEYVDEY